jgi:hypothetical protein
MEAERVAEAACGWAGLVEYASEVQVPSEVVELIAPLPVFADGKLCQLDLERFSKVFRSVRTIKEH